MGTLRKVHEKMNIIPKTTVLVCDYFDDSEITSTIKTNIGEITDFHVERAFFCFTERPRRHIDVYAAKAEDIEYISFA